LFLHPEEYFGDTQHLLGDSAYTPTLQMVPCFKKVIYLFKQALILQCQGSTNSSITESRKYAS
jgi:hypothetical protein